MISLLPSFRRKKTTRAVRNNRTPLKLRRVLLESLERRLPMDASFSFGGSTLTLNQFSEVESEAVTISQNDNGLVLRLAEGSFSGTQSSEATLVNPSTLLISATAAAGLSSISINDGSPGSGADPGVRMGAVDLPDAALNINGAGRFTQLSGTEANFDAVLANITDGSILGSLAIDDDESLSMTTQDDLRFGSDGELSSQGSTIELTVGGRLLGDGLVTSSPETGDGGNISITLQNGGNFGGTIDASGGDGQAAMNQLAATVGGNGGNITVMQTSSSDNPLRIMRLLAEGGSGGKDTTDGGRAAANGGDGGGITVTINGSESLRINEINASGGIGGNRANTGNAAGNGGTAGNISVTGTNLTVIEVLANGGQGGGAAGGGNAGNGGSGGAITLQGDADLGRGVQFMTLDTSGGRGGRATAMGSGGNGGDAGNMTVTATNASVIGNRVLANGGQGNQSQMGDAGDGGDGNSLSISAGQIASVQTISSRGGNGARSLNSVGGNGGSGGGAEISGDGAISILEVNVSGGIGRSGATNGDGGDAGTSSFTVAASGYRVRVDRAIARGGRGAGNGGDGGNLSFAGPQFDLGSLIVDGGMGMAGVDGDDGSISQSRV